MNFFPLSGERRDLYRMLDMEESMRVLVTGSSGFVGSHLVEELVRRKYTVRVLLRSAGIPKWFRDLPLEIVIAGYNDAGALRKAVDKVDIIFHVGGVTKALTPAGYLEGNALPTKALLDAVVAAKTRLKRFVLVSSHAMIGPVGSATESSCEDDVPHPVEEYGRSKLAAELVARSYSHLVPVTIVRPPTVYGPRDVDCLEIFKMIKNGINLYYGNAKKYTSLIYVDDLVEGMIRAAISPQAVSRAYFICNDEAVTWREFQTAVKKVMKRRALTLHVPACTTRIAVFFGELAMKCTKRPVILNREKAKLGRPRFWIASNKRARRELRFEPKHSMEEGLAITYRWYLDNGWL